MLLSANSQECLLWYGDKNRLRSNNQMLTQPILETTRLILRPFTLVNGPSIQRIASIREVADSMISIPHPYPDGDTNLNS